MFAAIANLLGVAPAGAIEALIRQVAELSIEGVCEKVSARIDDMTLSEARGYVRARAAQVVQRQTRLVLLQHREAQSDWAVQIVPAATERLIPLVIRQAGVGVPRPIELRKAA
ncbi:MAG: hypothetical protein KDA57_09260 [Planctomycetales bacterium]|nr:hypothetical protein [Planctomycetales bacterium]